MIKMHKDELIIHDDFVHKLLERQCLQFAHLPIKSITSSGTDHALFRLGDEYVIRLPRIEWIAGSVNKSITKEYEWIPKIARCLRIPISEPLFKGLPDQYYPWPWLIVKWNEGSNPSFEKENEYTDLAKDLACFLNELHNITLSDGPFSRRGIPLNELDKETKKAMHALIDEIDINVIADLWDRLSNTLSWDQGPVWVHGDFLPGNILIKNNRLSAVIDFSDVGLGDPACDFIIAWSLFNPYSRAIFRENLEHNDDNTWARGKGWALSIALIMLPYYKNSNPILAVLARQIIKNILSESE